MGGGAGVSTLNERTIKAARKNHNCHWCNERINKGESYHVWKGICEGDFSVFKTHPECNAAVERTLAHNGDFEIEAWDHERGLADHEAREEATDKDSLTVQATTEDSSVDQKEVQA